MPAGRFNRLLTALIVMLVLPDPSVMAADSPTFELSQEQFIAAAFAGEVPESRRVLISGELRDRVEAILQHPTRFLRTRYWLNAEKSVWVMEEIGRERPITIGIVVARNQGVSSIERVQVLAFRESRGWEVRQDFFTEQFRGAGLDQSGRGLDTAIDGITGATLSVRAVRKVAEIALVLDTHVRERPR